MSTKHTVTVELLGVKLPIKTTQTAYEVEQIAATVRARIEEIQRHSRTADSLRIALLAALDVARELADCKAELESLRDETAERTLALVERLEAEATGEFEAEPSSRSAKATV